MKSTTKWQAGPGGMKCGCCRCGTIREAKRGHNRVTRRRARIALARDEE